MVQLQQDGEGGELSGWEGERVEELHLFVCGERIENGWSSSLQLNAQEPVLDLMLLIKLRIS